MDPEPKKLKQNAILKFRNLKVTRTEHLESKTILLNRILFIIGSLILYVLSYILFLKVDIPIFRFLTARDLVFSGAATVRNGENQFKLHIYF